MENQEVSAVHKKIHTNNNNRNSNNNGNNSYKNNNILRPINSSQWRHIYTLHSLRVGYLAIATARHKFRPERFMVLRKIINRLSWEAIVCSLIHISVDCNIPYTRLSIFCCIYSHTVSELICIYFVAS